ncbi:hypothetical protein GC173_12410 [bacterium]|nr:hypothetical protein [bacterium]
MPCNDVTELLRVVLDAEDSLVGYELIKRSCGRAVGERSLLLDRWNGHTAAAILTLDGDEFAEALDVSDDTELVLTMKHFFAVQSGLRVLLGQESGGALDPVRVASIGTTHTGGLVLEAEIAIDVLTEKIQACGRCRGCGVKR